MIVGPDGKTPIKSQAEMKRYRAGGLQFETNMTPDQLLSKSLNTARQAIGAQAYQAAMSKTGSAVAAQTEAQTAAMNVGDPFMIEPAAMAVFMYLCREIEYRDMVIAEINKRLEALGAGPVELEHPYPPPPIEEVASEAEGDDEASEEEDGEVENAEEAPN